VSSKIFTSAIKRRVEVYIVAVEHLARGLDARPFGRIDYHLVALRDKLTRLEDLKAEDPRYF